MVRKSAIGRWLRATASDLLALLAAGILVLVVGEWNSARGQIVADIDDTKHAGEFIVPVNKSQVLRLDVPFAEILVGNHEIADVLALTDRSIYVLGKALGATSLTIYGENKELIAVADLVVALDVEGLKARLFEVMPKERIEVRPAFDSVILSGTVSNSSRLSRILAIANRYAPDKVTNLLSVRGSQQVMLAVRFSEVQRNVVKQLGLNTNLTKGGFSITSGDAAAATSFVTGTLGNIALGKFSLNILFDALEQKGVVTTLAEPNLIALSGDTASFLAGGEFPIEVQQEGGITVQFKEFGVSLAFTPTVLEDGLINLVVKPEVSAIDFTVRTAGGTPGLTTRRASTTVELRDGQSFAIAGLITNDFQDSVRQFPLLGEIPILGTLLRSTRFQRNETELVILVTPHLVRPGPAGALATPADGFVPPGEAELFLLGQIEMPPSGVAGFGGAGGIDGRFGHIIK